MTSSPAHGGAALHLGTCAWSFEDWRGSFYPAHLGHGRWLEFYSECFGSVEVDSTFYAVPSRHTTEHWREVTPPDFLFSVKMPREITHDHKLHDAQTLLAGFLKSLEPLGEKLACVLVQLPPYFTLRHDEQILRNFVRSLPSHPRFAIEFRDPAWHQSRIVHLLEKHRVCWAWHDMSALSRATEGPLDAMPLTTDFVYLRLLGDIKTKYDQRGERLHRYAGLQWDRAEGLDLWALCIEQRMGTVGRVLAYANNHFEGFAPETLRRLGERLGVPVRLPEGRADGLGGGQLEFFR